MKSHGCPEAAAAPTAEEAVPDVGRDRETAPLNQPEPEPEAELGRVRMDVLEQKRREPQQQEDLAQPADDEQGETISITLKEFITGNAIHVSICPDADIAALKRLIHEEHGGAEPDGQRLLLNDAPLEDETEKLRDLWIAEGTELQLGGQDVVEGRARREARVAERQRLRALRVLRGVQAYRREQEQEAKANHAKRVRVSAACVLCISLMAVGGAIQQVGVWATSPFGDDGSSSMGGSSAEGIAGYRHEELMVGGAALLMVGALGFEFGLDHEVGEFGVGGTLCRTRSLRTSHFSFGCCSACCSSHSPG